MKLSRMLHQQKTPLPRTFVTIWIAVIAALVVSGAYFMFERLASGLDVANATNLIPWGLWVSVYLPL